MTKKVKLQERITKGTYEKPLSKTYYVALPKGYVEALGWKKGDTLTAVVIDYEVEGEKIKGIFIFKKA